MQQYPQILPATPLHGGAAIINICSFLGRAGLLSVIKTGWYCQEKFRALKNGWPKQIGQPYISFCGVIRSRPKKMGSLLAFRLFSRFGRRLDIHQVFDGEPDHGDDRLTDGGKPLAALRGKCGWMQHNAKMLLVSIDPLLNSGTIRPLDTDFQFAEFFLVIGQNVAQQNRQPLGGKGA